MFTKGQTLYSIGLNVQCKYIVLSSTFEEELTDGRIVVQTETGIKVIVNKDDVYVTKAKARIAIRAHKLNPHS